MRSLYQISLFSFTHAHQFLHYTLPLPFFSVPMPGASGDDTDVKSSIVQQLSYCRRTWKEQELFEILGGVVTCLETITPNLRTDECSIESCSQIGI
mgnify:CR=1 FL=1